MAKGRNKGMQFERDTCRKLSLWWTDGKQDDVFWRSAASGGRATNRAKRGQATANSAGDIAALDKKGHKLLRKVAIELKRGYNDAHLTNLMDTLDSVKKNPILDFIVQAEMSARQAGVPYWWVIHQRDRKKTLIYCPFEMLSQMGNARKHKPVKFLAVVKAPSLRRYCGRVCCLVFDEFLDIYNREDFACL